MLTRLLRIAFFSVLACALAAWFFGSWRAALAGSPAAAGDALLQQATDYPFPDVTLPTDSAYPGELETPFAPTQEALPGAETPEPTSPVNIFATEDAQMQDALGTAVPSATPAPSMTPVNTATPALTATATAAAAAPVGAEQNRFAIDWSYFWIGFAAPLLVCCAVVLYLLDRYPNFFTPRAK